MSETTDPDELRGQITLFQERVKQHKIRRNSIQAAELIAAAGCNPFDGMIRVAQKAEIGIWVGQDRDGEDIYRPDYKLAGDMYSKLAEYCAPKLRPVDESTNDLAETIEAEAHNVTVTPPDWLPFEELQTESEGEDAEIIE